VQDLKSDLEIFEHYSNFNVTSLDSVRMKEDLIRGHQISDQSMIDQQIKCVENSFLKNTRDREYSMPNPQLTEKYEKQLDFAESVFNFYQDMETTKQRRNTDVLPMVPGSMI